MPNIPTLGKSQINSPVDSFILEISYYIDIIRPKDFFIFREDFDPNAYFITSGDAIKKTDILIKDLERYKQNIVEYLSVFSTYTETEIDFLSVLDTALESANNLLSDLYLAKGENCFLEIEWDNHVLYSIPKNPRAK